MDIITKTKQKENREQQIIRIVDNAVEGEVNDPHKTFASILNAMLKIGIYGDEDITYAKSYFSDKMMEHKSFHRAEHE